MKNGVLITMKTGLTARWVSLRRRNLHKKKKIFYWKTLIHSGTITGGSPLLLKKNLYVQEVQTESVDAYRQGRIDLENRGYTFNAIVLDGRPGVRQIFFDVPIQMCHFHQKQIITRYLTNNPKLEAGIELKKITDALCQTNERDFTDAINNWHQKWSSFLKERTTDSLTGKWFYTHKRLRSAYRSFKINLPYLFTYQKYSELNIPNTTNSLDGCFAYLKELVRVHRGINKTFKRKIIHEILTKRDPVFRH